MPLLDWSYSQENCTVRVQITIQVRIIISYLIISYWLSLVMEGERFQVVKAEESQKRLLSLENIFCLFFNVSFG